MDTEHFGGLLSAVTISHRYYQVLYLNFIVDVHVVVCTGRILSVSDHYFDVGTLNGDTEHALLPRMSKNRQLTE